MPTTAAPTRSGPAEGAVPGSGAEREVLPGDSTHAASMADMVGQVPVEGHEEDGEDVAGETAAASEDGVAKWLTWPDGALCVCVMGVPAPAAGMLCAPVMMCMPKIPAMMARAAVTRLARRKNTVTGPRDNAGIFLLPA